MSMSDDAWLDETLASLSNFENNIQYPTQQQLPFRFESNKQVYTPQETSPATSFEQMLQKPTNTSFALPVPVQQMQQQHENYRAHKQDYSQLKSNVSLQVTEQGNIHQTPNHYVDMVTPTYATTQATNPYQYQLKETGFQTSIYPQQQQQQQQYQQQPLFPQVFNVGNYSQFPNAQYQAPQTTYGQQQQQQAPIVLKEKQSIGIPQNFLDQFMKANDTGSATKQIKKKKIASLTKKKEPIRPVRPKVVPSKGAVQCMGTNLKKGTQCKNAALMEFFGPRPIYCAEHIELDPKSIYCKCLSPYNKEKGDGKGCKEVVLKEFSFCYKHFEHRIETYPASSTINAAQNDLARVSKLLEQLELEASIAKRQRHDLFQRKNKLIPKFVGMKKALEEFIANCPAEETQISCTTETPAFACPGDLVNASFLSEFNLDDEWNQINC